MRGLAILLMVAVAGCTGGSADPVPAASAATANASAAPPPSERQLCEQRIERVLKEPALPGAPGFEKERHQLLGRAKAEPVLFRRAPRPAADAPPQIDTYRKLVHDSPSPGWALMRLYKNLVYRPELARAMLLREGYLYAEKPSLATALVERVRLRHLFRTPRVFIQRGGRVLSASRGKRGDYFYDDGPERGRMARLLFLDRVAPTREELGEPLHWDVRSLAHRLGFDRMRVEHLAESGIVAHLRYGATDVRSLLRHDGTQLALDCELSDPKHVEQLARDRAFVSGRARHLARKREVIVQQVDEALPFDEPKTEEGQQDGNLRPAWKWAYARGWETYTFNEDLYFVYDGDGRPKVPQVCIDFVTDTLERASGTWWAPRGKAERRRSAGRLDFDAVGIVNRRSVQVFLEFARAKPAWFDVYDLAPEERVPLMRRGEFFDHIFEHRDRYAPGDIIAIHGLRNDGEMHYHSFFVYEADPVSGMPTLLAGNAGKPRIRTWEGVMRAAPRRSILSRVRPRYDWLRRIIPAADGGPDDGEGNAAPEPNAPLVISAPI